MGVNNFFLQFVSIKCSYCMLFSAYDGKLNFLSYGEDNLNLYFSYGSVGHANLSRKKYPINL